jgi:3-oxoacyl-[acyl-carrier protein] reductase
VKSKSSILVFGGRGAIGSAVRTRFAALDWDVTATSRSDVAASQADTTRWIVCDPSAGAAPLAQLGAGMPYAAVCWAQGANESDSVFDVEPAKHLQLYRANCLFVLQTLRELLTRDMLSRGARLAVVSSIWQRVARQNKLSYIMSKAAIGGLVQSASIDLAERGILINAVLPSALDTAMTSSNLTPEQIERIAGATGFGRLTSVDAVVAAIEFLCSERNTGITGQSVTVDLGYSHARIV